MREAVASAILITSARVCPEWWKMPIDRGVIDQQLQALGESTIWWERREFRDLPSVLRADERILAISRGKVARLRWVRRSWLIVVTDRRLVCIRSSGRMTWRQLEVNAGEIARVALRIGPFHGRVLVVAGGSRYRLLVSRADGYKLSATLSTLITPARETQSGLRRAGMVRRVMDHVLALPAIALSPDAPSRPPVVPAGNPELDERIQSLEEETEELRRQVRFLEDLLQRRQIGLEAPNRLSGGPGI